MKQLHLVGPLNKVVKNGFCSYICVDTWSYEWSYIPDIVYVRHCSSWCYSLKKLSITIISLKIPTLFTLFVLFIATLFIIYANVSSTTWLDNVIKWNEVGFKVWEAKRLYGSKKYIVMVLNWLFPRVAECNGLHEIGANIDLMVQSKKKDLRLSNLAFFSKIGWIKSFLELYRGHSQHKVCLDFNYIQL